MANLGWQAFWVSPDEYIYPSSKLHSRLLSRPKMGAKTRDAFAGMVLFGLLPRLSESVAWISGRTDTLAAFFTLSALAVYPHLHNQTSCRSLAQGFRIIVSALLMLAGLFCKEVAAAGLAAIAAWEFSAFLRRESCIYKCVLRLIPFLLIVLVYFSLRFGAMSGDRIAGGSSSLEFAHHASIIFAAIGIYLRMAVLFFLPEFQIGSIDVPSPVYIVLGMLSIAGIFLILFMFGLKKFLLSPLFSLSALCFAPLIMVIHILPLKMVSMAADRFIYVPAAAVSIALSLAFNCISTDKYKRISLVRHVLFGAVLCTCFAVLLNHVEHWTTERQLFSWGCKNAPDVNTNGCILLAARLIEDGMPEDALKAYEKVERLKDKSSAAVWETFSYPRMMHGRALALSNLGRHRDSIRTLQVMTENKKAKGSDHTNIQIMTKVPALLAMSYLRLGQIQEARSVVQKDIDILPLQNGVKLAASFERLAADVSRIINELNSDYEKPLSELSDTSLQKTMQLARLLDDRWMMTVSAVEALRRGRLNEQSQKSAIFYLEKKGICSAAAPLFENSEIISKRCETVPEEVTQ